MSEKNKIKVKVGVVGVGMVSYSHIDAYQAHPNAEVVAVCDKDEERVKQVAQIYGIKKYYTDYAEMLKDPEINTVDIATPTFMHVEMTIQAAEAGKNIHCEKPFCLNLEEGERACEAAKKNGVSLMVGESYVFMTSIMKARELIDAGEIGKPLQIRQRFGAWIERKDVFIGQQKSGIWRKDSAKAGGNGYPWMFDHCVHFFATAEYLMNGSKLKEVYAINSNPEKTDDISLMTWTYEDTDCQGVWMRAEQSKGKYDPYLGFTVQVIGEKGMIEVLGEGGKGLVHDNKPVHLLLHRRDQETVAMRFDEGEDEKWNSEVSYYSKAHQNQIFSFIDCLIEGKAPRYTGEDGYLAVKETIAAILSAKEKRPVKIEDVTDEWYSLIQ